MLKKVIIFFIGILFLNINFILAQGCEISEPPKDTYKARTHDAKVEVNWYKEWTDKYGENLPDTLPTLKRKWAEYLLEIFVTLQYYDQN